ncbi:polysaccharide lyase family 14 protein [Sphaerobolus stellatus SS14]|uniref:Polysaccharide lyase family 14 protein n=1 Tax=Sphaerobolus stellatus (strain SS14) TaxID=990650 RepID=A0A0C9UT75_SPHS4|nr:polysaccharide lyase family 14 protein [Sphaerobolus stellatus SS14]
MLFQTLAILAIAPGYALSAPWHHGPSRHRDNSTIVNINLLDSAASIKEAAAFPIEAFSTSNEEATTEAPCTEEDDANVITGEISTSTSTVKRAALLAALLPKGQGIRLWSTAQGIVTGAVQLSLSAFNPKSITQSAPAIFSTAPDGTAALEVHFKSGSWTYKGPKPSALSFYGRPLDFTGAKEVTTSYQVFFPSGFDFVKGGKLPGLYGGNDPSVAQGCSGGRRDTRCFSVRFMWRANGAGELYTYLPDPSFGSDFAGNTNLCTTVSGSVCSSVYGASVGRGSFYFPTGQWTTIAQRVRLNDPGVSNGELELIVEGESKFTIGGLRFTDSVNTAPVGLQAQSFFGGSTSDWASSNDQSLFMKNFNMVVTENF